MPRQRTTRRHPLRRASDPGGGTDSFSTFRQTLAWLIPTVATLLLGLLWLQRSIAVSIVTEHETAAQKELSGKIEALRVDLSSRMSTQWQQFYTKPEIDARRVELDRRLEGLERVGSKITEQQSATQNDLTKALAKLDTITSRQQDGRR